MWHITDLAYVYVLPVICMVVYMVLQHLIYICCMDVMSVVYVYIWSVHGWHYVIS